MHNRISDLGDNPKPAPNLRILNGHEDPPETQNVEHLTDEQRWQRSIQNDAWAFARKLCDGINADVASRLEALTPAERAAGSSVLKKATDDARRIFLESAVGHLWASSLLLAQASSIGCVSPQLVVGLKQHAGGWCAAAVSGMRCHCTWTGCDWRGTLIEVGPSQVCPACKRGVLRVLDLTGPNGPTPGLVTP